jgi:uroporphyrinogen-III decarboxylase
MENLEQALSFANYQLTLTQQRRLLTQKFQEATVIAYNGGLFKITPELIAGVKHLQSKWLLDMNGTPIKIENAGDFLADAETAYNKAINDYGDQFSALRLKRNVKSLVEL